jgi:membrane protein YqaA with SNARE-associated domain
MELGDRLTAIAESRAALVVAGVWGFAEATVFFIVPDVWVGFVAAFAPRRALPALVAVCVGAALGATLLYLVAPALPWLADVFVALPGIDASHLVKAEAALSDQGLAAFLSGIVAGDPVKLATRAAALAGTPLLAVLSMVVLNRIIRVGVTALIFGLIGVTFRAPIHRHAGIALALYTGFFVVLYLVYWSIR